ncbi:MAG: ribosomal RNA small subunit methyltransferase A [Candidatus Sungbacteria bacterium]|nr:ribosomal RNA small subunit methyltransferase A [Candidatus Sungbacteria bacterium]
MGQHFLADEIVLQKIVGCASPKPEETILEIGPGLGALTFELSRRAGKVAAVEKDPVLCQYLKKEIQEKNLKNIYVTCGDILKIPEEFFTAAVPYKVVASIPYYLTARLIRKLLSEVPAPNSLYLVIQKEVGERIIARSPHANLLATSVQLYGNPRILLSIGRKAFWPEPEVDSVLIAIESISKKTFESKRVSEELVFFLVRAGYHTRRKKLSSLLEEALTFPKSEIEGTLINLELRPDARAEALSPDDWLRLASLLPPRKA